MNLDQAQKNLLKIIKELGSTLDETLNEATTRLRVIDRILIEVLGWDRGEIIPEASTDTGYLDYLFTVQGYNPFVLEAKRTGHDLVNTITSKTINPQIGGAALKSAQEGVRQALRYCSEQGAPFAALTSGKVWIGFLTGGGKPLKDRKTFVFPSLQSITEDFGTFYDLFSREGVLSKKYLTLFSRIDGTTVTHTGHLNRFITNEKVRMLPRHDLANDLDPVFARFFGSLTDDNDRELLLNCFVETKESREADASLEKISRDLVNTVETLSTDQGERLANEIRTAIENARGEVVLIIGNKGAGKSTFIERFFEHVLARNIRERCLVLRIDMAQAPRRDAAISDWLTNKLLSAIEAQLYGAKHPDYDELQGIFFSDYQRWSTGEYKHLYETLHDDFKNKFGEYMYAERQNKPYDYALRLLKNAVVAREKLPCLIFDNTDQFPQEFQDAVFQFAQSIHRAVLSILIIPITDRPIWQMSKAGPFQSYQSKAFYLPVPSTKEILERRVAFVRKKTQEDKSYSGQYFLSKGIRLSVKNVEAFAACLEEMFLNTDYISRLMGSVANYEIRRTLEVAKRITTSPSLKIDGLIKTYLTGGLLSVPEYQVYLALFLGDYNYFQPDESSFVCNLFEVNPNDITSPLLKLSILRLLLDKAPATADISDKYLSLETMENYFLPMGFSPRHITKATEELLQFRLIEPYNPADDNIAPTLRVCVTSSGRMHFELALRNFMYVGQMAIRTGLRYPADVDKVKAAYNDKSSGKRDWFGVCSAFICYCLSQDEVFVTVPQDLEYAGQESLREELGVYWKKRELPLSLDEKIA